MGFLSCDVCKDLFRARDREFGFDRWGNGEPVQLVNNPASWGAESPRRYLLGFSKGGTQNKAMGDVIRGRALFEAIPFKGMRRRLQWILEAIGLLERGRSVDSIFVSSEREIQSASLIRCSISARMPNGTYTYKLKDILSADAGTGGLVKEVMRRCVRKHLGTALPGSAFVMLGLDDEQIGLTKSVIGEIFGPLESRHETTYRSQDMSWLHVAHPAQQTDPQCRKWAEGTYSKPKVAWARAELAYRTSTEGNAKRL